jgi:queuine tRNA-ribosyltransferase
LGLELASLHNLTFYLWLMHEIREHIKEGTFKEWYPGMAKQLMGRL